jgi:hypothetical protein
MRIGRLFGALLSLPLVVLVSACGAHGQTPQGTPGPTVTETLTSTALVTTTATVLKTTKVTVAPTQQHNPTTSTFDPPPAPPNTSSSSPAAFDRAWALHATGQMVHDIKTVDFRLHDGIAVSSALYLLSDDYPRLLDAGIPAGVDEAEYRSRLTTLSSFAETAGDEYFDQPTTGAARYAVVRKETGVLFAQLNSSVGTDLQLP